jgi:hypothetical protein
MKNRSGILCIGLILLMASGVAWSCPDLIEVDCGGGSAWFGLRHDGANVAHGQSYLLDCSSPSK